MRVRAWRVAVLLLPGCASAVDVGTVSESVPDAGAATSPKGGEASDTDSGAEAKPIGVVVDAGHVGVEAADAGPGEASVPGSEAEPDAGTVVAPDPLRGPVRCATTATVVYVCNDGGPSTYDYAAGVDVQGGQPVTWVTFGDAGGTGMCQETSVSGSVPVCPTGAVCFVDGNAFGPGVQGKCL